MSNARKLSKPTRRRLRRLLIERDGTTCWLCGSPMMPADTAHWNPKAMTIDHVVRIADGGSDDLGNLRLAHKFCNETRDA